MKVPEFSMSDLLAVIAGVLMVIQFLYNKYKEKKRCSKFDLHYHDIFRIIKELKDKTKEECGLSANKKYMLKVLLEAFRSEVITSIADIAYSNLSNKELKNCIDELILTIERDAEILLKCSCVPEEEVTLFFHILEMYFVILREEVSDIIISELYDDQYQRVVLILDVMAGILLSFIGTLGKKINNEGENNEST